MIHRTKLNRDHPPLCAENLTGSSILFTPTILEGVGTKMVGLSNTARVSVQEHAIKLTIVPLVNIDKYFRRTELRYVDQLIEG